MIFYTFCSIFIFITGVTLIRHLQISGLSGIFMSPITLTGLTFMLIHMLMPLWQEIESYYRYSPGYTEETLLYSLLIACGAQLVLVVVLYGKKKVPVVASLNLHRTFVRKAFIITAIFFIVGLIVAGLHLKEIFSQGIEGYLRDRIGYGTGSGFSILTAHWVYVCCLLFFGLYSKFRTPSSLRRWLLFFTVLSFLFSCFYYGVNGNRNSIFILIINMIGIWLVLGKSFPKANNASKYKKTIQMSLIAIIALYGFFSVGKSRLEGTGAIVEQYSLIRSVNGAFGNNENILWLMSNDFDLEYGMTYVAGVTNFIPRSLWPEKPLGAGPRLKNNIDPGSYVVGQKNNSSLTTGLYTELYLNFGVLGIFLGVIIYGIILRVLFKRLCRTRSYAEFQLYLFCFIIFSTQFYYSEFVGFIARLAISIIPILGIVLFTSENAISTHSQEKYT